MVLLVFAIIAIFFGSIAMILRWHHHVNAGMALLALDDSFGDTMSTAFHGTALGLDGLSSA